MTDEYDKDISYYTRAIKRDSKNTAAYKHRGFAYKQKGEYDKATADLEKAEEIGY
jgi:tetratricopeptide (TPR) repeat protein